MPPHVYAIADSAYRCMLQGMYQLIRLTLCSSQSYTFTTQCYILILNHMYAYSYCTQFSKFFSSPFQILIIQWHHQLDVSDSDILLSVCFFFTGTVVGRLVVIDRYGLVSLSVLSALQKQNGLNKQKLYCQRQ